MMRSQELIYYYYYYLYSLSFINYKLLLSLIYLNYRCCTSCSAKLKPTYTCCWSCGAEVTSPQGHVSVVSTALNSDKLKSSFGRPFSMEGFRKMKASQHRYLDPKKVKVSELVTINIGLKKLVDDDLKSVWGKRLPISVPKSANYKLILEKGIAKYKAFQLQDI